MHEVDVNRYFGHFPANLLRSLWPENRLFEGNCGRVGGAEGDRTPDLLNAIQALSQLSYGPV